MVKSYIDTSCTQRRGLGQINFYTVLSHRGILSGFFQHIHTGHIRQHLETPQLAMFCYNAQQTDKSHTELFQKVAYRSLDIKRQYTKCPIGVGLRYCIETYASLTDMTEK